MSTLISILCGLSSSFYLKGIIGHSLFQPTLFSTLALLFYICFIDYKTIRTDSPFIFLSLIIFLTFGLLVVQTTFTEHTFGFLNEFGRIVYPFLVCFIVFTISRTNKFSFEVYFLTLVFLLTIDTIYRLYIVNDALIPVQSRYEVKGGGLIYADSNFTAFIAGTLFFLADKYKKKLKKYVFIKTFLFVITVLSASFAAYAAFICTFFFKLVSSRKFITKIAIYILCILIFLLGLRYTQLISFNDGSLKTKIQILKYFISYLEHSDKINLFFGVGFGNFRYYNNYMHASHSMPGLFVEGGIILILMSAVFYSALAFQKENRVPIVFILVAALSMYPIAYLAPLYILLVTNIDSFKSKSNFL